MHVIPICARDYVFLFHDKVFRQRNKFKSKKSVGAKFNACAFHSLIYADESSMLPRCDYRCTVSLHLFFGYYHTG